jgi:diadenosine tetraphosphate (Ap4A) HIT family hydrolase
MLSFFKPKKINIASFGNYMPHVHWHIMARFEEDSYFPEPIWGEKQREGSYKLEKFDEFLELLKQKLK